MRRLFLAAAALAAAAAAADVTLTADSEIVVAPDAPSATRLAADELSRFLEGVFGKRISTVTSRTPGKTAVVLGAILPAAPCGCSCFSENRI